MLEQLNNGDSETVDEENPWAAMAVPIPSIPTKSGLDSQCNNYACDLVYRALVSVSLVLLSDVVGCGMLTCVGCVFSVVVPGHVGEVVSSMCQPFGWCDVQMLQLPAKSVRCPIDLCR